MIIHSLTIYLLPFKFVKALRAYWGIIFKDDFFKLDNIVFGDYFKLLLSFHIVSTRYIQLFCFLMQFWQSLLSHLFFLQPSTSLQKICLRYTFLYLFCTSKGLWLSGSFSVLLCWLSASPYLNSSTYTWDFTFLPFFYTDSVFFTAVRSQ